MPKDKVSYRVYQHKRVKHKIALYDASVYPVYISVMYGRRALNFKGHVLEHLLKQPGYNLPARLASVETVMQQESQVIGFIIESLGIQFAPDIFKQQYAFYCTDLLLKMEEQVKQFLIFFFNSKGMPSIAHLISSMPGHLSADIIIKDLQKSLSPVLLQNLLYDPFFQQMPYIPLKRFYESVTIDTPVLMVYNFYRQSFLDVLFLFLNNNYPQFVGFNFLKWIDRLFENRISEEVRKKTA
jgi:hypothetical protein